MTARLDVTSVDIGNKTFLIAKFPATVGREILLQYPTSIVPKIGEYKTNHALMLKIMEYAGVQIDGRDDPMWLTSEALVNNHVPNGEALLKLEWAIIRHNYDFFGDGRASGFLQLLLDKAGSLTSETLTKFVGASLGKVSQP